MYKESDVKKTQNVQSAINLLEDCSLCHRNAFRYMHTAITLLNSVFLRANIKFSVWNFTVVCYGRCVTYNDVVYMLNTGLC